jgi:hypothetical protein
MSSWPISVPCPPGSSPITSSSLKTGTWPAHSPGNLTLTRSGRTSLFCQGIGSAKSVFDPLTANVRTFDDMHRSFTESVLAGDFAKEVPVVTGVTADEGLVLAAPLYKSKQKWRKLFQVRSLLKHIVIILSFSPLTHWNQAHLCFVP